MLPAGDLWMEWTLRLVGMGIDGQSRSFNVMAISRPAGLGDIANLGITLSEAKQLLVRVQQQVVAEQANTHATFRGTVQRSGGSCRFSKGRTRIGNPVKTMSKPGTECAVIDCATDLEQ